MVPDERPTVLIVYDIEDNRTLRRNFLTQKHNCRVVEAKDGEVALRLALHESPALILMDIYDAEGRVYRAEQAKTRTSAIAAWQS